MFLPVCASSYENIFLLYVIQGLMHITIMDLVEFIFQELGRIYVFLCINVDL